MHVRSVSGACEGVMMHVRGVSGACEGELCM